MNLSPAALTMLMQGKQNPRALLSQMVAELAEDDPQLAMVGQYMLQASEEGNREDEDVSAENDDTEPAGLAPLGRERLDESELLSLRDEIGAVQSELAEQSELLQDLLDRNDELAAALGACPRCWGENAECSSCHGSGIPGSMLPDKQCLTYYVAPALRRVRTAVAAKRTKPCPIQSGLNQSGFSPVPAPGPLP
jgi:hypothetical protein